MHETAAAALEFELGAPGNEHPSFRPAYLAELDRREEFPAAACKVLDDFGLNEYYVPAGAGGSLRDYTELLQLLRTVARRDLTVAVAHGKTFLGGASVWVAGSSEQAAHLGDLITDGAVVSWGLTERHHGSDLLAGELMATPIADTWRLTGEKWLINNATRGRAVCVLARTAREGGPRGFSLFLVDKQRLADGSWSTLPKVPTHGIRGADISGIEFHDAQVPGTALVGEAGDGIETVLKALQLTRTTCVALSLGAVDTALRIGLDYARDRSLYGRRLIELPRIRRILGRVSAERLVAEAAGIVAVRSIHALTGEMSVTSAVAKALVPDLVQGAVDRVAELLGVRGFLTKAYADGVFAKLERDHRVVSIFDGNTAVNRNALIDQFPLLAAGYRRRRCDAAGVRHATDLGAPPPEFAPGRLALLSSGGCSLVQSLPDAVARVRAQAAEGLLPRQVAALADRIRQATDTLHEELATRQRSARTVPSAAFARAERYELCYAAAACLQLWLGNMPLPEARGEQPTVWHDGLWLQACLHTIATRLGLPLEEADDAVYDRLVEHFLEDRVPTLFSPPHHEAARSTS
ncbi:acyl-CoA dehydrogenase family protein [Streptomyces sp. ISL-100]|uniref:acyl-CoA dehydrogenase family protein n=1 Tax=Streptomyces sp. ISL-100 TaxID=2819173 RepID=UPI001BE8628E|nr:acyl-CoA dehydrogenase family protein [Streptomyces sp. ISL-100]MBT2398896.1 acyl-CoA dehydrogenase family protein [Streptomyces sp. ISL-100]